ncbi:MAG: hypothetical protein K0R38_3655 [Polyangiaceae bacterium]|jgi:hypothetical protein|nr:hypothetical protein [Polyangiaceae bacterium]
MTSVRHRGRALSALGLVVALGTSSVACSSDDDGKTKALAKGQSEFSSAPPSSQGRNGPVLGAEDGAASGGGGTASGPGAQPPKSDAGGVKREVEETDLYRLDGDRLYYLNQYRGLMVFDVSDVDHPQMLGRSPIYGSPVEMVVRDGIASVVVADWYGTMNDGTPFHGSIVRGIDARDPANMKVTGEALLGGWVRDTRVVGDVLYAVTEKYSWDYGWWGYASDGGAVGVSGNNGPNVSVASVSFAGGAVEAVDNYDVPGWGGIFNVTSSSILLASDVLGQPDQYGYAAPTGQSTLRYLDISDAGGEIVERGSVVVDGSVQSWGADGGRWNLDFADGKTAHVVGRSYDYNSSTPNNGLSISTADFSNPDAPVVTGSLQQPMPGWDATARFDGSRLYLSPNSWGCNYDNSGNATGTLRTPLDVYDLSDMAMPKKLGTGAIDGQISLMIPNGDRLFALGNVYDCVGGYKSPISLAYFDMTDPTQPKSLGSAEFGTGWAWTPAAGTFKAFTKNDAEGLVVLPFSGWDPSGYQYNNGLQLIEFTADAIKTSGTAKTTGWVERGIFVKNRLVSLSNLALSVVDYGSHAEPTVVAELTLARNVVNVKPIGGKNVAEVSSDFWDNDTNHSELRVLPLAEAEENVADATLASATIDGTNPTVFHDGDLSFVVSNVRREVACEGGSSAPEPGYPGKDVNLKCYSWTQEVQVVDTAGGSAELRGKIALPNRGNSYYGGWGWYGCGMYDWYYGSDVVQVDGNKLAFRRWEPQYDAAGGYVDARQSLFVVDAANPDAPSLASVVVTSEQNGWWGNLRAVGDQLYASHYEWEEEPRYDTGNYQPGRVRYYLDQVDLSDASQPRIGRKINVPGFLVGGSEENPNVVYTMDYHWDGSAITNDLAVLELNGDRAYLKGHVAIPGNSGNVFVRGKTAYFSAQTWDDERRTSSVQLYQVDLSDPQNPTVLPSKETEGWGWLLGVEGDRAFVTSGWANQGVDIFKLAPGKAPVYDQFVRTRGWWTSSLARQGDQVLLASGYWGTQVINLK